MIMSFRTVKAKIVELLGNEAAGRYRVVGYEPQPQSASQYTGANRTIRAFFSSGEFPFSSGSVGGPAKHNVSMLLEMIVTASSEIDVGTLEDEGSTDSQRAAALAGTTPAAQIADEQFDEFLDIIWNILMMPGNQWLNHTKYQVGDRWVPSFKKDKIIPMGNFVIVTGYIKLDFNVEEIATGASASAFEYNVTTFNPIDGDTVQKTVQRT